MDYPDPIKTIETLRGEPTIEDAKKQDLMITKF
jgi:hypothetical protein